MDGIEDKINYKMLEIKDVTKIYNTKGGVVTHALNGVSISFGETGLVFLLGKSGSGKSTLLNVSGGLDEPTSGEIIVKGKSSKDFTGSDFDSYRNTFVGFIFQEYNILDEFNVEDNIALALELQGKNKDREKIQSILRSVELEAFAKRKPNTLSGGQKQRIAIARALVKDPQIIMADEPTGALDSATGKQVFDTLKELSKTRLVIVVSHDREFAEIYGDRIVELADGKIISDVVKTCVPAKEIDENVSIIGENTLSIKKGTSLSPENIKTIQEFISKTDGDVIISNGEREISSFKKVNRMSESGSTEKFESTPADAVADKEYTAEESQFIRSRLPASKAIRIGASGLKIKPIRLIFTIFLSVISFIMFGIASTLMMYDGDSVLVKSFSESDYNYLALNKHYLTHTTYGGKDEFVYKNSLKFTDDDFKWFKDKYGDDTFAYFENDFSIENLTVENLKRSYYTNTFTKLAAIPEGNTLRKGIKGTYPENDDEIAISSYMVEVFKENSAYTVDYNESTGKIENYLNMPLEIKSADDIIGKYIRLSVDGDKIYKVTGVVDSGEIPAKYDGIKQGNETNQLTLFDWEGYKSGSIMTTAFFSQSFCDYYAKNFVYRDNMYIYPFMYGSFNEIQMLRYEFNYDTQDWEQVGNDHSLGCTEFLAYEGNSVFNTYLVGGKNSFGEEDVLIDINRIAGDTFFYEDIVKFYMTQSTAGDTVSKYREASEKYSIFRRKAAIICWDRVLNDETGSYEYTTKEMREEAFKYVDGVLKNIQPIKAKLQVDESNIYDVNIVGFYYLDNPNVRYSDGFIFSQSFIDGYLRVNDSFRNETTNYKYEEGQIYSGLFLAYNGTDAAIKDILTVIGDDNARENDVCFTLNNVIYQNVDMVNDLVDSMSLVFLIIGIVLAVFSALLLFNFISVSISNKRKEIGILRAVGARGLDVFKIFFAESGIIVGICLIIALIGSFVSCMLINSILKTEAGIAVTLFVFGPASIGLLLGIAVLVAVISTFLPVFFASRKKPVESIRAL